MPRLVLCHRGSLDPLAYWLAYGWTEGGFFACTVTTRQEHYSRYDAVIHLVTAAEGALHAYRRYPAAHRGETPQEAVHLDRLLRRGRRWSSADGRRWAERSVGCWICPTI